MTPKKIKLSSFEKSNYGPYLKYGAILLTVVLIGLISVHQAKWNSIQKQVSQLIQNTNQQLKPWLEAMQSSVVDLSKLAQINIAPKEVELGVYVTCENCAVDGSFPDYAQLNPKTIDGVEALELIDEAHVTSLPALLINDVSYNKLTPEQQSKFRFQNNYYVHYFTPQYVIDNPVDSYFVINNRGQEDPIYLYVEDDNTSIYAKSQEINYLRSYFPSIPIHLKIQAQTDLDLTKQLLCGIMNARTMPTNFEVLQSWFGTETESPAEIQAAYQTCLDSNKHEDNSLISQAEQTKYNHPLKNFIVYQNRVYPYEYNLSKLINVVPHYNNDGSDTANINLGDTLNWGNSQSSVVITEYSDYACPFCAKHHSLVLPELKSEFGDTIYYQKRDFPLTKIHPNAIQAAVAARCIALLDESVYDAFVDSLYFEQSSWTRQNDPTPFFKSLVPHLDEQDFDTCVASPQNLASVQADFTEGVEQFVRATPSFIITSPQGSEVIEGLLSWHDFKRLIEEKLAEEPLPENEDDIKEDSTQ